MSIKVVWRFCLFLWRVQIQKNRKRERQSLMFFAMRQRKPITDSLGNGNASIYAVILFQYYNVFLFFYMLFCSTYKISNYNCVLNCRLQCCKIDVSYISA